VPNSVLNLKLFMTSEEIRNGVLVVGAGGSLGLGISRGFRRAGYIVYGVVRGEKHVQELLRNEIIPVVVPDAYQIDKYASYIKHASVIVDATLVLGDDDPTALPKALIKAADEASKNRPPIFPKKTFIYTSGIMVYDHDERVRDETWPIGTRPYSIWRSAVEAATIHAENLNGIVIRPGWVFGYDGVGGRPFADFLFGGKHQTISIAGDHHDRKYSWIHVDDLAEAYVAAANKASYLHGEIFNIVNGYDSPSWEELSRKGATLAGVKDVKIEWKPKENKMDDIIDATVILHSAKARRLLDWTPKIFGFYDNLEHYYNFWKAFHDVRKA